MYLDALKKLVYTHRYFFIPYGLLLVLALIIQFTCTQFEVSLFVNSLHNNILDSFFHFTTQIGDGLFAAAIALALLIFKRAYFWSSILCFYIPALVTQFLKRVVFSHHLRPSVLMKDFTQLHYVPGVDMHGLHSFPSGHTTSAFAVFLFLAFISSNKKWGAGFLAIALLVGLSRIYLLQHFFEDVLMGSCIGVVFCTLIYLIFETYREKSN